MSETENSKRKYYPQFLNDYLVSEKKYGLNVKD